MHFHVIDFWPLYGHKLRIRTATFTACFCHHCSKWWVKTIEPMLIIANFSFSESVSKTSFYYYYTFPILLLSLPLWYYSITINVIIYIAIVIMDIINFYFNVNWCHVVSSKRLHRFAFVWLLTEIFRNFLTVNKKWYILLSCCLCHSCRFDYKQRVIRMFPGPGYLRCIYILYIYICMYICVSINCVYDKFVCCMYISNNPLVVVLMSWFIYY